MQFRDRSEAGRLLATKLARYANQPGLLVLGLPRGGVPVAYEVAVRLNAPLDAFVVRKLGVPGQEELAMGAIASGGIRVVNRHVVESMGISPPAIDAVAAKEMAELNRRERVYHGTRSPPDVRRRTVVLVDDGIATGATMEAAILALRHAHAAKIVVGAPTVAKDTFDELRGKVDDLQAVITPEDFRGVGQWYADFPQVTDQEVQAILQMRTVGAARQEDFL